MDWATITGILAGNSIQVSNTSAIKRTKYSSGSRNTTSRAWGTYSTQLSMENSSKNCTWFGAPQFKNSTYELESVQRKRMITGLENISYKTTSERTGFDSTRRETIEDMWAFQWVKDCFKRTGLCQFSVFYESLSKGNGSIHSNEDVVS